MPSIGPVFLLGKTASLLLGQVLVAASSCKHHYSYKPLSRGCIPFFPSSFFLLPCSFCNTYALETPNRTKVSSTITTQQPITCHDHVSKVRLTETKWRTTTISHPSPISIWRLSRVSVTARTRGIPPAKKYVKRLAS